MEVEVLICCNCVSAAVLKISHKIHSYHRWTDKNIILILMWCVICDVEFKKVLVLTGHTAPQICERVTHNLKKGRDHNSNRELPDQLEKVSSL